jgi:hypothetical protein
MWTVVHILRGKGSKLQVKSAFTVPRHHKNQQLHQQCMLQPLLKTYVDLCGSCRWLSPHQVSFLVNSKFQLKISSLGRSNRGKLNFKPATSRSDRARARARRPTYAAVPRRPDPPPLAGRPCARGAIIMSRAPPEQIPLRAHSSPCVAARRRPGQVPAGDCAPRTPDAST